MPKYTPKIPMRPMKYKAPIAKLKPEEQIIGVGAKPEDYNPKSRSDYALPKKDKASSPAPKKSAKKAVKKATGASKPATKKNDNWTKFMGL